VRHLLMEAHLQQDAARMTVEGMLWLMHGQHLVPLMLCVQCGSRMSWTGHIQWTLVSRTSACASKS
jgi:hypothetical protein